MQLSKDKIFVTENKRQRKSHKRQPYLQLSKNKIFGSIVEEVQYRESSRGLVSHGLFVAREVVAENKRQRRSSKRSTYIAVLVRLGSFTINVLVS